jgi:hypothetical protein
METTKKPEPGPALPFEDGCSIRTYRINGVLGFLSIDIQKALKLSNIRNSTSKFSADLYQRVQLEDTKKLGGVLSIQGVQTLLKSVKPTVCYFSEYYF